MDAVVGLFFFCWFHLKHTNNTEVPSNSEERSIILPCCWTFKNFPHYFTKFKPASKVSSTTFVTHFVNFHNCWFILLSHGPPIFATSLSWRGPFFKLNYFPIIGPDCILHILASFIILGVKVKGRGQISYVYVIYHDQNPDFTGNEAVYMYLWGGSIQREEGNYRGERIKWSLYLNNQFRMSRANSGFKVKPRAQWAADVRQHLSTFL